MELCNDHPDVKPIRPQCPEDWDARKAVLVELYIEKDLKLPELSEVMTKEHGFLATVNQYKKKFKKWKLSKNVTTDEMRAMRNIRKRRRDEKDKETEFRFRGRPVPEEKMERFAKRRKINRAGARSPPVESVASTPSGVSYWTPRDQVHTPSELNFTSPRGEAPEAALTPGVQDLDMIDIGTPRVAWHPTPDGRDQALVAEAPFKDATLSGESMALDQWPDTVPTPEVVDYPPRHSNRADDHMHLQSFEAMALDDADDENDSDDNCSIASDDTVVPRAHNLPLEGGDSNDGIDCDVAEINAEEFYSSDSDNSDISLEVVSTPAFDQAIKERVIPVIPSQLDVVALNQALRGAVRRNDAESVRSLIEKGAQFESANSRGMTPLLIAAYYGHADIIRILLEMGADPFARMQGSVDVSVFCAALYEPGVRKIVTLDKPLAIQIAASNKHVAASQILVKADAEDVFNIIQWALDAQYKDVVDFLAKHEIGMDQLRMDDADLLEKAAAGGCEFLAEAILKRNPEIGWDLEEAMIEAVYSGSVPCARLLHPLMADIDRVRGLPILHTGVHSGHPEMVQFLLDCRAHTSITDPDGINTAVHYALQRGELACTDLLIRADLDHAYDETESRELLDAVLDDYTEETEQNRALLKTMVSHGVNIDARDSVTRFTALHDASGADCLCRWQVDILLSVGASTEARDKDGWTALHFAVCPRDSNAYEGESNVVIEQLLAAGADVDAVTNDKKTALLLASKEGKVQSIELLLEAGADTSLADNDGRTALHYVATSSPWDAEQCALRKVLAAGAHVDAVTNKSETALLLAVMDENWEVVQILVAAGADPNIADEVESTPLTEDDNSSGLRENGGNTPLHAAAMGSTDNVDLLLKAGADPNAINANGNTPLHLASRWSEVGDVFTLLANMFTLIANGADVNILNQDREAPMLLAAREDHFEILHYLSGTAANPNVHDRNGESPLHYVARRSTSWSPTEATAVVNALICKGCMVNQVNRWGSCALHEAVLHGNLDISRGLLDAGADIDSKVSGGYTAIQYAVLQRDRRLFELLKEYGASLAPRDDQGRSLVILAVSSDNNLPPAPNGIDTAAWPSLLRNRHKDTDKDICAILEVILTTCNTQDVLKDNWRGKTVLQMAVEAGLTSTASLILRVGQAPCMLHQSHILGFEHEGYCQGVRALLMEDSMLMAGDPHYSLALATMYWNMKDLSYFARHNILTQIMQVCEEKGVLLQVQELASKGDWLWFEREKTWIEQLRVSYLKSSLDPFMGQVAGPAIQ